MYFYITILIILYGLCQKYQQAEIQIKKDIPIKGEIIEGEIDYYYYSVNQDDTLFITLSTCDQIGERPLEIKYLISDSFDKNIENWKHVSMDFSEPKDSPFTKSSLASYLYGFKYFTLKKVKTSHVYFAVKIDESDKGSRINYQIALSTNDYYEKVDTTPIARFLDSDYRTASIIINPYSFHEELEFSNFQLKYFEFESSRRLNTLCYINYNNRSTILQNKNGGFRTTAKYFPTTDKEDYNSTLYEAHFENLKESTNYVAYIIDTKHRITYPPVYFSTRAYNQQCYLTNDFSFCDQAYYSIPVPASDDISLKESFLDERLRVKKAVQLYDKKASDAFANFTSLIEQYDCKSHRYSPVRNCDDCLNAYKTWLCAITIPRCYPETADDSNKLIKFRSSSDGLKPFVYDELKISSFYEVKPCPDLCHHVVQSCPTNFNFLCPHPKRNLELIYYEGDGPGGGAINQFKSQIKDFFSKDFSNSESNPSPKLPICNMLLSNEYDFLILSNSSYAKSSSIIILPFVFGFNYPLIYFLIFYFFILTYSI